MVTVTGSVMTSSVTRALMAAANADGHDSATNGILTDA